MTVESKETAAEAAGALNDAAAILAIGAGVAAGAAVFTGGVGAGVAAVLAVGSGVAWLIGNEYGDLALDPPRYDYHLVARFAPRKIELPAAEDRTEEVWNEFNRTQIEMSDAIAAMTTSFERLAGARLDLRKPGADADMLARRITAQRQAIRHNAEAARLRIRSLLRLRSRVNAAWRARAEAIRKGTGTMSAEERQRAAATVWGRIAPTLRRAVSDHARLSRIQKLFEDAARTTPEISDEILGSRWHEAMTRMEKRLAVFAGERSIIPVRHELAQTVR